MDQMDGGNISWGGIRGARCCWATVQMYFRSSPVPVVCIRLRGVRQRKNNQEERRDRGRDRNRCRNPTISNGYITYEPKMLAFGTPHQCRVHQRVSSNSPLFVCRVEEESPLKDSHRGGRRRAGQIIGIFVEPTCTADWD